MDDGITSFANAGELCQLFRDAAMVAETRAIFGEPGYKLMREYNRIRVPYGDIHRYEGTGAMRFDFSMGFEGLAKGQPEPGFILFCNPGHVLKREEYDLYDDRAPVNEKGQVQEFWGDLLYNLRCAPVDAQEALKFAMKCVAPAYESRLDEVLNKGRKVGHLVNTLKDVQKLKMAKAAHDARLI